MAKTGNPFMDFDMSSMSDFTKMLEQFKVPGMDGSALLDSQRKNLEAITNANKVTFEGAQAVARRQAEIMQEAMGEMNKVVRELAEPGTPEAKMAKQADLAKEIFETAIANVRELAEMGARSNAEAVEMINQRVSASLDEIKSMIGQAGGKSK